MIRPGTSLFRLICSCMMLLAQPSTSYIYLPMIVRPAPVVTTPGLFGRVTVDGSPVKGVMLDLQFYDGSSWSTAAVEKTDSDGAFSFLKQPSLAPGQMYSVHYRNNSNPDRLSIWRTRNITAYEANASVDLGTFDLSNIAFSAPKSGSTVRLPYTFSWIARPAASPESYQFHLFDPKDGNPWFITDPPLGYASSYLLERLPDGFTTNVEYGWSITINSSDGGYGESYYYYNVTFQ